MNRSIIAVTFALVTAAGCGGGGAALHGDDSSPLSVADALRTRPAGIFEVRGDVVAHPDGSARLCEGLAGSFPPQCAGQSILVVGLDLDALEHADSANGVTWGMATLRGKLEGHVLKLA
jgi:hypothetical protein